MNTRTLAVTATVASLTLGAGPALAKKHGHPHPHRPARSHKHPAKPKKAHTVTFSARVVSSSASGLTLRTLDGKLVSFSAKQLRAATAVHAAADRGSLRHADLQLAAGGVVINLTGLQPGVLVQVTVTVAPDGSITVSIALPASQPTDESASGVINDIADDGFTLTTTDGSQLRLHMAPDALSALNLQECDTADVVYDQVAGLLIAKSATSTGQSTSGDCAPTSDTNGVISAVSDSSVTITTDGGTSQTYSVDPSSNLTDGFQVGDLVDVTSKDNGDGTQSAACIQYVEEEIKGQVTSVTTTRDGGSLAVDDGSGNPVTLNADASHGVQLNTYAFNGIQAGDNVDATYRQVAGELVADTVSEQ